MRTLATMIGLLSTLSFQSWAFNSHLVETTPAEFINANAQINYQSYTTSKGKRPAGIRGLVGIVDGYAVLKLSCANDGSVSVKHNLLNGPSQHVSVDNQALKTTLSQVNYSLSSMEQVEQLKQGRYLLFSEQAITTGNLKLDRKAISLKGFATTYDRMQQLCSVGHVDLAMR
ncbi:hypothetical protein [Agarivorans aestuarii]|uniref:hypothetical protein n=1 Tax=Agarivorans aestuarii TaxID=1563703 RepID=UPI001C7E51DB|nr:hypothetical protein [Agarivorans aestuarii]